MDNYDVRAELQSDEIEQDEFDAAPIEDARMLDADEIYWIFSADPNPQ